MEKLSVLVITVKTDCCLMNKKVIDAVRNIAEEISLGDGRRLSASQFLQHFLFTPETQYNYIHKLSGGEKRPPLSLYGIDQ